MKKQKNTTTIEGFIIPNPRMIQDNPVRSPFPTAFEMIIENNTVTPINTIT